MNHLNKIWALVALFNVYFTCVFALEQADQAAIQGIIQSYTDAWNQQAGKGFADHFAEDADFVNIFGMHFSSRSEIEERHIKILQTFHKDSKLKISDVQFREVQPGLVIAVIHWVLDGFRYPGSDISKPGETRKGIFTQVFINLGKKWEITASQNTLIPN